MYNVIIDGDNVSLQKYFDILEPILKETYKELNTPLLVCQSNIILKYKRGYQGNIRILCSNTNSKNSADARIIFETGILFQKGEQIIIVSNDKIYKEIECERIVVFQFDSRKVISPP
jgi:hypothetical protein